MPIFHDPITSWKVPNFRQEKMVLQVDAAMDHLCQDIFIDPIPGRILNEVPI